ncbi:hypothetical protein RB195_010603 [Necator americanus]|uniref:Uncharacterized protein n=1 Tax=Necator americanus TaxID=51031 RepID=A0ABR1D111_NECAM
MRGHDMKNAERISANVCPSMLEYAPARSFAMQIRSQIAPRTLQGKYFWFKCRKKFAFVQAPPAPEPEHAHEPTYAVNEEHQKSRGSGLYPKDEKWKIRWRRRN